MRIFQDRGWSRPWSLWGRRAHAEARLGRDPRGFDDERGAILPMMAIVLVVLMGSAAMAVDLGWLYWQSIEIQHGADAAALAGVIYEPVQRTNAHTAGIEAAVQNGFVHDPADGNAIEIIDFVDDPTAVQHDSQLRATLTKRVPTFFLGIMGIQTVDISRTALAEFVQPLALGSPESSFGTEQLQQASARPAATVDPEDAKCRRLARALVSDILVYNRDQRDKALANGNLVQALGVEIKKSWEMYKDKVTAEVDGLSDFFRLGLTPDRMRCIRPGS